MRFSICDEVALGEFTDSNLVFLAAQMRLLEINHTTKRILGFLQKGQRMDGIVAHLSNESSMEAEEIFSEVSTVIMDLVKSGVIHARVKWMKKGEAPMSEESKFMANPEVSCRVEDEDGAILFNPDSNSVQIINPIGLQIWQFMEHYPRTLDVVKQHIMEMYEDAPLDSVEKDIRDFVMTLNAKGFIGEVTDE